MSSVEQSPIAAPSQMRTTVVHPAAPAAGIAARASRPPVVLHVRVVTGHGGGPEKTILNSVRHLREHGYDARLAYLHPPGDEGFTTLQTRARAADAELISVPDRGPFDLTVVARLLAICRSNTIAIWHAHDYKSHILGLVISRLWPCRLVRTVHGWGVVSGRMPLYNSIDRLALRFYQSTICVSDDLRDACLRARVRPDRCRVVYNAIDTHEFRRRRSVAEAKLAAGASPTEVLVGAVGRLSGEKRFDLLIDAVCRVRQGGLPVALWIAGEGEQRSALEQQIDRLACGSFVRLLGHVPDPRPFYEALDLYALSSVSEGLPNVVLEAMAMHVPVVATRVAGVPVLLDGGSSGVIVEPGDVGSLVDGMNQLLADEQKRSELVGRARERVESLFSFDQRMRKVVAIYDEVLSSAAGSIGRHQHPSR